GLEGVIAERSAAPIVEPHVRAQRRIAAVKFLQFFALVLTARAPVPSGAHFSLTWLKCAHSNHTQE
ncbi:MAG: hypothetical protein WAL01_23835, partial [Pseudolabrys sp.]